MAAKIPATVVTGFLGAGKTTLIRHMLQNAEGKKIALIINEFGDLGVDGDILKGCGDEVCTEDDIVELSNGCICCTVADDFIPTMEALLARDVKPDHIVIETSGLALPQPLVRAFNWPGISTKVTVDGQEVPWEASEEVGLFVSGVVVTMEPGAIVTVEVEVDGPTDLDEGYQLALWSPLTAQPTPVTATVEILGAPQSPIEAALESIAGPAALVVPLDEQ